MITTRNITIASGESEQLIIRGNFIRCLEADDTVFLSTTPINGNGSTFEIESGLSFQTREFSSFRVENKTGLAVTLKLVISDEGFVNDDRLPQIDFDFGNSNGSDYTFSSSSYAAGQLMQLCPDNQNRKKFTYQITGQCKIPDVNGIVLDPGIYSWDNKKGVNIYMVEASIVNKLEETY